MLFGKKDWKETVIHIEGMHCAMCSTRMCNAFTANKHVKEAKVDLEAKTATVTYDANGIDLEGLKKIVTDTGYEVV